MEDHWQSFVSQVASILKKMKGVTDLWTETNKSPTPATLELLNSIEIDIQKLSRYSTDGVDSKVARDAREAYQVLKGGI